MGLRVHDQQLTERVGAIALLVLCGLIAGLFVLARYDLRAHITATVYFTHVGPLREGAEVQVAGRVIGKVDAITLIPGRFSAEPKHPLAGQDGVGVKVRIQARYAARAPLNGTYFISAKGILGERFIEVGPPPGNGPRERALSDGDQVRGIDAPHLDRAFWRGYQSMQIAREFGREIAPETHRLVRATRDLTATIEAMQVGPQVRALGDSLAPLMTQTRALMTAWAQQDLRWSDIQRLQTQAQAALARSQAVLDQAQAETRAIAATLQRIQRQVPDDLFDRARAIIDQIEAALAQSQNTLATLDELWTRFQNGQGTAGALLNDPEFFDEVKELGKTLKRQPWRLVGPPPAE